MANQIQNTAVEFFISKNLQDALAVNGVNPGSICFVANEDENTHVVDHYIVLNGEIYGGVTQLELNKIPVTKNNLGETTSTLADYFDENGVLLSKTITIVQDGTDGFGNNILETVITLNNNGIYIGNAINNDTKVLTSAQVNALISANTTAWLAAIQQAITSIYRVKGSVADYNALLATENPKVGDVWNVIAEVRKTVIDPQTGESHVEGVWSPGTNFVCKSIQETQNGTEVEWDALGGTFDATLYYTRTQTDAAVAAGVTTAEGYTDTKIAEITAGVGSIQALASRVTTNETNIATNRTNIQTLNNRLTWQ